MNSLCHQDDIPEGDARGFLVGGHEVVVVKHDNQIGVFLNWCPHLGIPLNYQPDVFMDLDGRFLQCANHGALFDPRDGNCVSGPCVGQHLQAVPFEISGGQVFVPKAPHAPL